MEKNLLQESFLWDCMLLTNGSVKKSHKHKVCLRHMKEERYACAKKVQLLHSINSKLMLFPYLGFQNARNDKTYQPGRKKCYINNPVALWAPY